MTANHLILMLLSLGLLASLYFSMQIKLELRRSEISWQKEVEQVRFQINDQRSKWIQTVQKAEAPALSLAAAVAPARSITRSKQDSLWATATKSQAVEMVRRGESSAKISAALSLPKPQVEFLMKLERTAAKA